MMEGAEEAIRALDEKMAEREGELERLRQLLAQVESDLRTLRKAKDLLVGTETSSKLGEDASPKFAEDAAPRTLRRARDLPFSETAPPPPRRDEVRRGEPAPPAGRPAAGPRQGPLRSLVLDILREAGKPLHVEEIVERLRAMGKPTDAAAVTVTLADHVKSGKLWRTPQDTYAPPKGFGL